MEEMSKRFQMAVSMGDFNPEQAIRLYDEELKEDPKNFAAMQNRGLCKLKIAIQNKNQQLLEDSKVDFRNAIKTADETGIKGFPIAEANLKWAEETTFDQ